jgi:hypothetical protein
MSDTKRIFVLANYRSKKALAVLECTSLTSREAKVPAGVNLSNVKPGMIARPAADNPRQPDWTRLTVIAEVRQAKTGNSTITFRVTEEEKAPPPPKKEEPEKK